MEDRIFTIGTTADAAKFEVVKEELGKHFATQSWSDGVDAAMSFDTLTEPSYHQPEEPEFPLKMMDGVGDQKVEDPEYEVKLIQYRIRAQKYVHCNDEYSKLVKSWKNNHSCMFNIVLQHSQILKTKDVAPVSQVVTSHPRRRSIIRRLILARTRSLVRITQCMCPCHRGTRRLHAAA